MTFLRKYIRKSHINSKFVIKWSSAEHTRNGGLVLACLVCNKSVFFLAVGATWEKKGKSLAKVLVSNISPAFSCLSRSHNLS